MATLHVDEFPDALYHQLALRAKLHQRSIGTEAILLLQALLADQSQTTPSTASPDWAAFSDLMRHIWSTPVADQRGADEIIGYGDDGLPR